MERDPSVLLQISRSATLAVSACFGIHPRSNRDFPAAGDGQTVAQVDRETQQVPHLNSQTLCKASNTAEQLLKKAELVFGSRDTDCTFSGVTKCQGGPMLIYSGDKQAMIGISSDADECQLLFQLAHEVVHLLSPRAGQSDAMMIEEGAAVWFSIYGHEFPIADYKDRALEHIHTDVGSRNYRRALDLYVELEAFYPNSIRALRAAQLWFYEMTPEFIVEKVGASRELADQLCECVAMRPR